MREPLSRCRFPQFLVADEHVELGPHLCALAYAPIADRGCRCLWLAGGGRWQCATALEVLPPAVRGVLLLGYACLDCWSQAFVRFLGMGNKASLSVVCIC